MGREELGVRVLGPVEVEVAGRGAPLASRRQQALIALLVVHAGTVVSVSQIAEALWEDDPTGAVANTVQTHVSRLRRSLGVGREAIVTRPPGYLLTVEREAIDAARFESLLGRARATATEQPAEAARLLDHALAEWRGRAYEPFADSFARADATRLEEMRLAALEQRASLSLTCGDVDEAIARASGLARSHPLRERPLDTLMRALHAAGRTADALAEYRRHREMLDRELGLESSAALQALERHILRDDLPTPSVPRTRTGTELPRASPTRLPWPPGELIGREAELTWLRGGLAPGRAVTLTGAGGVGKTRLALEMAHEHERTGQRVYWVDLTTVQPEGVAAAIAHAAAAEVADLERPTARLCELLSSRRGLMCLDNAEHVLDEVAEFVECLAASASDLAILVTSRERLGLDIEAQQAVPPLALPDGPDDRNPAVRLFLQRWQSAAFTTVEAPEIAVVADLVRRLDGLPLAIELAAAQASTLGILAVVERLGARLDLLSGGRRTSPPRHRTMRAVVAWSHDRLAPDEAELFRRLAVFPGAFTVAQAEAVCSGDGLHPGQIAPLLSRLVEQSLLQVAPEQFWVLETLRAYAVERLDDTLTRLAARHAQDTADRLRQAAQELWTPREAQAVATLEALLPDLHAAWQHAHEHDLELAAGLAADVFGFAYVRQRLDLLRWSLAISSRDLHHPRMPDVLAAAAAAAWAAGDLDRADDLTARGIELAGGADQLAAASPLDVSADLAMFRGRTDQAVARYREVADLHRRAGSSLGALMAEIAGAQAASYGQHSYSQWARAEELLDRARATGIPTAMAFAHFVAGETIARVDGDRALAHYREAIAQGDAASSRLFVTLARDAAAAVSATRDPPTRHAVEQFAWVLHDWEQIDNAAGQWATLRNLVVLLERLGHDQDAVVIAGAVHAHQGSRWQAAPHVVRREPDAHTRLRARLGDRAYEAALAEGRKLSLGRAVRRALTALEAARRADASEPYAP